jgi:hypothetical protein
MFAYWRGLPESDSLRVEVLASASLTWGQCEDDVSILMLGVPSELTRGDAEQRQRLFISSLDQFEWFDPGLLEGAEQISPIRVAPATMLRGFFREATGPRLGPGRRRRTLQAPRHRAGHLRRDRAGDARGLGDLARPLPDLLRLRPGVMEN